MALVAAGQRARPTTRLARRAGALSLALVALGFGLQLHREPRVAPVAASEPIMFDVSLRSSGDAIAVERWLRAGGLRAEAIDAAATLVHVSGSAAAVEARLAVSLERYTDHGISFHRPVHAPVFPPDIALRVQSVLGLDDRSAQLVQPDVDTPPQVACAARNACLTRDELAKAFDLGPLYDRNVLGVGQTVAIVGNGAVDAADLAQFDQLEGINGPIDFTMKSVDPLQDVDGGQAGDAGQEEATMDVETVHMIAPAAKIIYYQTTFAGTGLLDAYKRILTDGQASIVSISIGACDPAKPDPNDVQIPEGEALAALRQKHVNVFVSSGDHGVYACIAAAWAGHDPYWAVAGSWPGDSADVVSVGGTYLQHGADGTYESEAAWVSPLTNWSTGGGVNPSVAAPAWQTGLRVGPPAGVTNRAFPDVAAPADEESGWTIVVKGQIDRSSGTSAAAPFWAGYAALVRQAAGEAHTGTFPFLAPVLYAIANSSAGAGSFHDVTRGSNLRDNAETGWDDATGLGSPVGANLADAIVSYLQANPSAAANDTR